MKVDYSSASNEEVGTNKIAMINDHGKDSDFDF